MSDFKSLLQKVRGKDWQAPPEVLALDPGETTGWALFEYGLLVDAGQTNKHKEVVTAVTELQMLFRMTNPSFVVIEDYRVYAHKAKSHSWEALHTPKLIGAIQALCAVRGTADILQMASSKQFVTNDKLRMWKMYYKGKPHANDAIRHGCYYLLFNKGIGKIGSTI